MKLAMIGVDYKTAGIELREKISVTESKLKMLLTQLKELPFISGAAIISTCNRTELYLSYFEYKKEDDLKNLYCDLVGIDPKIAMEHIYIKSGDAVITYLFELASGIHSMIFGDDQITAQVGEAIEFANELQVSDSVLNTLFRHAITCAKKVRSSVTLKAVSPSVANQAIGILRDYMEHNKNPKVLVIGNGEVGRIAGKLLVQAGCEVYMTLRTYKYKQNVVPMGCKTLEYEKRSEYFSEVDIIISATKSPHHTVSYEALMECAKRPKYIMDLALPRDIDPRVKELKDIIYYDIDSIGKNARYDNTKEIHKIMEIINGQMTKFKDWMLYRKNSKKQILEECKI